MESPREGRLSKDPARVENADVTQLSLMIDMSSSNGSSGGLSSTSIGLRLKGEKLSSWLKSFSETCDRGTMESTVIRDSLEDCRWRMLPRLLGGGMFVTANSAATEDGMPFGECASRRR